MAKADYSTSGCSRRSRLSNPLNLPGLSNVEAARIRKEADENDATYRARSLSCLDLSALHSCTLAFRLCVNRLIGIMKLFSPIMVQKMPLWRLFRPASPRFGQFP